jgi:hypothetical protein
MVPAMFPGPALSSAAASFAVLSDEVIYFVAVLVDQALDLFAARAGLWTGIRYGAAKADIVANEIGPARILECVLHVRLLHLEVAVDVASVVRLVSLRHLMLLHAGSPCCVNAFTSNWANRVRGASRTVR